MLVKLVVAMMGVVSPVTRLPTARWCPSHLWTARSSHGPTAGPTEWGLPHGKPESGKSLPGKLPVQSIFSLWLFIPTVFQQLEDAEATSITEISCWKTIRGWVKICHVKSKILPKFEKLFFVAWVFEGFCLSLSFLLEYWVSFYFESFQKCPISKHD